MYGKTECTPCFAVRIHWKACYLTSYHYKAEQQQHLKGLNLLLLLSISCYQTIYGSTTFDLNERYSFTSFNGSHLGT